jgi:hypothetical protein
MHIFSKVTAISHILIFHIEAFPHLYGQRLIKQIAYLDSLFFYNKVSYFLSVPVTESQVLFSPIIL